MPFRRPHGLRPTLSGSDHGTQPASLWRFRIAASRGGHATQGHAQTSLSMPHGAPSSVRVLNARGHLLPRGEKEQPRTRILAPLVRTPHPGPLPARSMFGGEGARRSRGRIEETGRMPVPLEDVVEEKQKKNTGRRPVPPKRLRTPVRRRRGLGTPCPCPRG